MDGAALLLRLPTDLLERIDTPQLDVLRGVAQLIDCSGKPLSDLPLTRNAQLSEGEVDTNQHRCTAEALEQRRARAVLELVSPLLRVDFLYRIQAGQLVVGERWVEQAWEEQHACE